MSYKVKLDFFEGPFDLLVYLIETSEMSIYDIEISTITSQYLEYLKAMEELDINIGTEFMVLAATLIEIKSKMILPRIKSDGETDLMEDPREELVTKLLEYKRFKEAAEILRRKEEECLDIFEKPREDISIYTDNPDEYLKLDTAHFVNAFNLFISRKKRVEEVRRHYTRVARERVSMENRINFIVTNLRNKLGETFDFSELVENKKDRYDVVITFVSLLAMAKEKVCSLKQERNYGNIKVAAGERINSNNINYEQ